MQKSLKISIMGKQYSIATDQDNNDDIIQAALLVDQLMKNKTAQSALSEEKVAVVVALQLAADLQKKIRLLESWQQKAFGLSSLLSDESELF
ncbi:cell division protein ZapA [Candidatus Dependentiae bacterium]|jgi:cell division protein ZapA (FtsZ GTPase activity inhibitor)|nr:cell division protein ZapA [Candidatus Dependentiae bacterium]